MPITESLCISDMLIKYSLPRPKLEYLVYLTQLPRIPPWIGNSFPRDITRTLLLPEAQVLQK